MKFALYLVTLMVPWTAPIQSFSDPRQKFVLDVSKNDRVWVKHLDVGIKFNRKNLSAAAREVLTDLKVLKAMRATDAVEPEPGAELAQDQEQDAGIAEEEARGQKHNVLAARALHIVIEVASRYNKHGMALDFAMDAIASAIKCKTLMYILVQLHAIKRTHELKNDVIILQPAEVWNTLVQVLDKVAVLKQSVDEEYELYQQWEVVATQVQIQDLPQDFDVFQSLVEKKLDERCELSTFEQIKGHIRFEKADSWDTADDTMYIFTECQKILTEMFKNIPISTMDMRVWESVLNKPAFKEKDDPSFQ